MANPQVVDLEGRDMSTNDEYDLFTDEEDEQVNDLPKKLRAKIKELSEENKSLLEENTTLKGDKRNRTLAETLTAKGLNPKIAAFIPKDIEDDQIDTWITEYADVFGAPSGGQAADQQQPVIARDAEQAAAIRQLAAAETAGTNPPMADILAGIDAAQSVEEVMALLRQA